MRVGIEVDGVAHDVVVDRKAGTVSVDGQTFPVRLAPNSAGVQVDVAGRTLHVNLGASQVDGAPVSWRITALHLRDGPGDAGGAGGARVRPPMNGKLDRLLVKPGQTVAKGDVLFVLEAMKMQNEVRSPVAGTVQAVHAQAGATVDPSTVIVEIA